MIEQRRFFRAVAPWKFSDQGRAKSIFKSFAISVNGAVGASEMDGQGRRGD